MRTRDDNDVDSTDIKQMGHTGVETSVISTISYFL